MQRFGDHNAKNRELYNQCHTNPYYQKYQELKHARNSMVDTTRNTDTTSGDHDGIPVDKLVPFVL